MPTSAVTTRPAPGAVPPEWPAVSVVMPVRNEARHLAGAVGCVFAQDYPGPLEIVLAVGPSTDRTEAIAADLAARDGRLRVVTNPSGATASGLNAAIAVARHQVIARVDGHAMLPPHYLHRAVELLHETDAANVGGVMAAEGGTDFERAVAAAMTSPFGVGNGRFHYGGPPGPADTVYLGVFRRTALESAGGYDESFLRAQDAELNHRIRAAGGTVYFHPDLRVSYRPRSTLRDLARQYFNYGRWRRVVLRRHPSSVRARYLAPPLTVLAVAGGVAAAVAGRRKGLLLPAGYLGGVLAASAVVGRRLPPGVACRLPVVLVTMHGAWGLGFLTSPADLAGAEGQQRAVPQARQRLRM